MKRAFTLIELLIVVAIIGILAAIAVPNFMNAQIRAKIARNTADLRSVWTAIEQLRLDKSYLPIDVWDYQTEEGKKILREQFNNVGAAPEGSRTPDLILAVLTSPIAYMSAVPFDPFLDKGRDAAERGFEVPLTTYVYIDEDPNITGPDMQFYALQHNESANIAPLEDGEFALIGAGPDGKLGDRATVEGNQMRGLPYDVSNGLSSIGDIFVRCPFCLK